MGAEIMFEVITNAFTGEVTQRDLTEDEIAALQLTAAELAAQARAKRNYLLDLSDWTQTLDAPVDQVAWAAYRQALRDITAQASFPQNINWPVAPN